MTDGRRIRLYREDHDTGDNRRLAETLWGDEPIPAMMSAGGDKHYPSRLIGTITNVRREDEGWVTGVLTTDADVSGMAAEADFIGDFGSKFDGDVAVVTGAQLKAVVLGTNPCWDGMVLD